MGTETRVYEFSNDEIQKKFKVVGEIEKVELTESGIKVTSQVQTG